MCGGSSLKSFQVIGESELEKSKYITSILMTSFLHIFHWSGYDLTSLSPSEEKHIIRRNFKEPQHTFYTCSYFIRFYLLFYNFIIKKV